MKQSNGTPVGIDLSLFWTNLFLCSYEAEYVPWLIFTDKLKARNFHSTKVFINYLCARNDGGVFGRSFCDTYPKEFELKVQHQGEHATFSNLDVTLKEETFIYELFDKRATRSFSIVIMSDKSNIPQNIFYSASQLYLCLTDFLPNAKKLLYLMKKQGPLQIILQVIIWEKQY